MSFESQGERGLSVRSPGGFEFGIAGWIWGDPKPTSITFFLDGSCMVCDQYGRQIRRAVGTDGATLRFADTPPEANKEGEVLPRPQFATHAQTIEALTSERIDWLAHRVSYRGRDNAPQARGGLTADAAAKLQAKLIQDGATGVQVVREIACAGWPQLPYEELKRLPALPPTPLAELEKIPDPAMRAAAVRAREEASKAAGQRVKTERD